MKKALMTATVASMIDQFNMPNIKLLQELGYEVTVACNFLEGNTCTDEVISKLKNTLIEMNVKIVQIDFTRSPYSPKFLKAYNQIKKLINEEKFNIIHTHAPLSSMFVRGASKKARKKGTKVIYTAHGFHFYTGSSKLNWLIYYPIERCFSKFTDVLITINKEDYQLAKTKMNAKKLEYIPGIGVDIDKLSNSLVDIEQKRKELGIEKDKIILFSVGELVENKNHKVIIEAMAKLKNKNVLYIIAGKGKGKNELIEIAKANGVSDKLKLLGFRTDINELFATSDIFCFPSIREGLSVSLMEALACSKASIVSEIRGNTDLVEHGKNGFLCNKFSSDEFAHYIDKLIEDRELRDSFGVYAGEKIENFSIIKVNEMMKKIYEEI